MGFLIAKILVLLLLAAAFGAWFAAWWVRRRYQDVTTEHTSLRSEWSAWRADIDRRLATPADFSALTQRLGSLEAGVRGIHVPPPQATDLAPVLAAVGAIRMPQPERVDLAPLAGRIGALEERIAALRFPQPSAPPDLGPLHSGLQALQQHVAGIVIPAPPKEIDLAPVQTRLGALEQAVRDIRMPPLPAPVDLGPLASEVHELRERIVAIRMPEPAKMPTLPPPPDLEPLRQRLDALAAAVAALPNRAPAALDLTPIERQLDRQLERQIAGVRTLFAELPQPAAPDLARPLEPLTARLAAVEHRLAALRLPEHTPVDLQPLQQRLHGIEQAVAAIRLPQTPAPDFTPLQRQLDALGQAVAALPRAQAPVVQVDLGPTQERLSRVEQAVRGIVIPAAPNLEEVNRRLQEMDQRIRDLRFPEAAPPADLGPVLQRLDALSMQMHERPPAEPAHQPAPARPTVRAGSRNLLMRAAHGKPDDLKRINGVAEVLEGMLHRVGVYYFWQIAEWDAADIEYVDRQLTAFKGRIKRDEWVVQARHFLREGGVASKPTSEAA